MSPKDAIKHIVEEIDTKLLGRGNQCLKGVPSSNPLTGPGLQTHIALAHPFSGSQFSWIVVQMYFGLSMYNDQCDFFCNITSFHIFLHHIPYAHPADIT